LEGEELRDKELWKDWKLARLGKEMKKILF
jgi:hypothetical protein